MWCQGPAGRVDAAERGQAAAPGPVQLRRGQAQRDAPGTPQALLCCLENSVALMSRGLLMNQAATLGRTCTTTRLRH